MKKTKKLTMYQGKQQARKILTKFVINSGMKEQIQFWDLLCDYLLNRKLDSWTYKKEKK